MITLSFALIILGGLMAFRSGFGVVLAVIGVAITPWRYLGYAALLGAAFAVLIFALSFRSSSD